MIQATSITTILNLCKNMAVDVTSGFPIFSQNIKQAAYAFIANRREPYDSPICILSKYPWVYYASKPRDVYACEVSRFQRDYTVQFDLLLENVNYNSYDLALQVNEPMRYNVFLPNTPTVTAEYKLLMNWIIPFEIPNPIYTTFGEFRYGAIILSPDYTLPSHLGMYSWRQILEQTRRLLLENIWLPLE